MNWVQLFGIGGPSVAIAAAAGFLLKTWMAKKESDRADVATRRLSESGTVETTAALLELARKQIAGWDGDLEAMRNANSALRDRLYAKETEIEELRRRVAAVEGENARLRALVTNEITDASNWREQHP